MFNFQCFVTILLFIRLYTLQLFRQCKITSYYVSYGKSSVMDETYERETEVDHMDEVWCRYTHRKEEPWKRVNFLKRNRHLDTETAQKIFQASCNKSS